MKLEEVSWFASSKDVFMASNNHPEHDLIGLLYQFDSKVIIKLKQIVHCFLDIKTTRLPFSLFMLMT